MLALCVCVCVCVCVYVSYCLYPNGQALLENIIEPEATYRLLVALSTLVSLCCILWALRGHAIYASVSANIPFCVCVLSLLMYFSLPISYIPPPPPLLGTAAATTTTTATTSTATTTSTAATTYSNTNTPTTRITSRWAVVKL